MQESMHACRTVLWNLLDEKDQKKVTNGGNFGLHIHCPSTATPKDGPSAGGAITVAMLSSITGVRIKNDVATTGEIDIKGNITAIGGLRLKLNGAKESGVKHVFVPRENEKDLENVKRTDPALFTKDFKVTIVDNVFDLCKGMLVRDDLDKKGISLDDLEKRFKALNGHEGPSGIPGQGSAEGCWLCCPCHWLHG